MTGAWGVYRDGQRWGRSPRRAWLVLRAAGHEVVQFDGPVLELMTASRARFDQRLAGARPRHPRRPSSTRRASCARLRDDDPTRPIGDALLDQRTIAGIGNLWKCEGCFDAAVDPWRPTGEVSDDEALRDRARSRARACSSPRATATRSARPAIYGRVGRPCPRCGAPIRARGQGDDNRTTYWCPGCQH